MKKCTVRQLFLVGNQRREMFFALWYASSSPHYMDDINFLVFARKASVKDENWQWMVSNLKFHVLNRWNRPRYNYFFYARSNDHQRPETSKHCQTCWCGSSTSCSTLHCYAFNQKWRPRALLKDFKRNLCKNAGICGF